MILGDLPMYRRSFAAVLAVILLAGLAPTAFALDELKNTDPEKYYIVLDLGNQVVTVYEKDALGEYTKIVRRFICTSGSTQVDPLDPESVATPTPRGVYKMGARERFGKFANFGGTYARYWTQIIGNIYFHSIMYSRRDINTLQSGAYSDLGRNVSHGCVRLYVEDAKWLYYYAPPGTTVEVTSKRLDSAMKKKLKYSTRFKEYNAFQKRIFDIDEMPNPTAWVVHDGADVRTGSGHSDTRIFRLKEGDEVEVLQTGDPWLKIKFNDREGYVKNCFVTFEKGVMQSSPEADIMRGTYYLFTEPTEKSEPIAKIPFDTSVKILETVAETEKTSWHKIAYENVTGYIKTGWVKKGWGVIRT